MSIKKTPESAKKPNQCRRIHVRYSTNALLVLVFARDLLLRKRKTPKRENWIIRYRREVSNAYQEEFARSSGTAATTGVPGRHAAISGRGRGGWSGWFEKEIYKFPEDALDIFDGNHFNARYVGKLNKWRLKRSTGSQLLVDYSELCTKI